MPFTSYKCVGVEEKEKPQTVRVLANIFPPYTARCIASFPTDCNQLGWETEHLYMALQRMKYQAKFFLAKNHEEMVEGVRNRTYNVTSYTLLPNTPGLTVTPPVVEDRIVLFVPKILSSSKPRSILSGTCSPAVYSIFPATFLLNLLVKFLAKKWPRSRGIQKISDLLWSLVFVVYLGVFSSFLTLSLSRPPVREKLFRNSPELASLFLSGTCRAVIVSREGPTEIVISGKSSYPFAPVVQSALQKAYVKNPPLHGNDSLYNFGKILLQSEQCRIGAGYSSSITAFNRIFGSDSVDLIPFDEIPTQLYGFGVQNNTSLIDTLRMYFSAGSPVGNHRDLVEASEKKAKMRMVQDSEKNLPPDPQNLGSPLKFHDLTETFWFLLVFSVACSLYLGVELWIYQFEKGSETTKTTFLNTIRSYLNH